MNREPSNREPARRAVWLARPRGFCAGVCRALATVEAVLKRFGKPVFVNHEIVHNRHVVDDLRRRGVVFIDDLDEVPPGRPLVFSAHGVTTKFARAARRRGLKVVDATCPLVAKVHRKGRRAETDGRTVVLVGHQDHPEVIGTLGQMRRPALVLEKTADVAKLPKLDGRLITVLTQTTLTRDDVAGVLAALSRRFPGLDVGDDICYATCNRQAAVRRLAERCPVVLVVGSPHSSNSRRLVEVARGAGASAHLVESAKDIRAPWLRGCRSVGVTAAASAPEHLVKEVVARLRQLGWQAVREMPGQDEKVVFKLPPIEGTATAQKKLKRCQSGISRSS